MDLNHSTPTSNSTFLYPAKFTLTTPSPNSYSAHNTVPLTILSSSGGTIGGALILTIVFLLGVPGNVFVAWSILARTHRQSVTTLLILNLACADGSLMALTPFFIVYLVKRGWMFQLAMCKVLFYFCCANMYASIFLITVMSLHRLVAVVWPQRVAAMTARRNVVRVLVLLWVLALALAVPVLVFRQLTPIVSDGSNMTRIVCDCKHPDPKYVVMQYTMETFLGFLLPYSIILGSYICILRKIRQTKFQRRIRSEKLILTIVITFGLFWLPYHIINMVQVAEALCQDCPLKEKLLRLWTSLRALASTVAFISSCINPILYTLVGKSYIRDAGVAFMARLFDTAGIDTLSRRERQSRQSSQNSRDQERDKGEREGLREKECNSTTSTNTTSILKSVSLKNGK